MDRKQGTVSREPRIGVFRRALCRDIGSHSGPCGRGQDRGRKVRHSGVVRAERENSLPAMPSGQRRYHLNRDGKRPEDGGELIQNVPYRARAVPRLLPIHLR